MDPYDEFAEFDTTEDEFDTMFAAGEPVEVTTSWPARGQTVLLLSSLAHTVTASRVESPEGHSGQTRTLRLTAA